METTIYPLHLSVFFLSALVLLLTPGPAVLYIVTRSIDQGRRAGLASVLGIELGNSIHAIAAALGLSAILLASSVMFSIIKYAGAAYLIYLGIRTLLKPPETTLASAAYRKNLQGTFWQGFVVGTLNPKTALFFLAFLPQFVDAGKGNISQQFLLLGFTFVAMAIITDSAFALLSGAAGEWLRHNRWFARFQRYVAGIIFIGLGITAAVAGQRFK